jgi:metallophosphoesterase (TIGR00282 family)
MSDNIKILFLGDIVGRPGRNSVKYFLQNMEELIGYKADFVIANCENASHGFGLTEKNYRELIEYGIDILTSGNHIWDRKEIFHYIDQAEKLVRPLNYPDVTPGKGTIVISKDNYKVAVVNVLGRVFMEPYESPWKLIKSEITKLQMETPIVIVDFHAEATAEKIAFGHYMSQLGVTALLGTHTHVQTADEKILNNTTAYITDAGYCGADNSVIGMDVNTSISRLKSLLPVRYEIPPIENTVINAIMLTVNINNGLPLSIERIVQHFDLKKIMDEGKLV